MNLEYLLSKITDNYEQYNELMFIHKYNNQESKEVLVKLTIEYLECNMKLFTDPIIDSEKLKSNWKFSLAKQEPLDIINDFLAPFNFQESSINTLFDSRSYREASFVPSMSKMVSEYYV